MFLDVCVLIILGIAIWKGLQKGLVVALFSFAGIFIGIAAALKMSALVAGWLSASVAVNATWLPFLAFIIIIIAVSLLVRMGAGIVQTMLDLSLLGWVNKLAGILVYIALYMIVFSILIFYAEKMQWLTPAAITQSKSYPLLHKVGPLGIELFGKLIPIFKGMFAELSNFFEALNKDLSPITTTIY
jgi:membrane protein required for colicin V production